jgi:hypothetical protein
MTRSRSPSDFSPLTKTHVSTNYGNEDAITPIALIQNYAENLDSDSISNELNVVPNDNHPRNPVYQVHG